MYYYEVFVAEQRYQKAEPLTYSSEQELNLGAVVCVPYSQRLVCGFVIKKTTKPKFATKVIKELISNTLLPRELIDLHSWMLDFYPSGSGAITQLFIPADLRARPREDKLTNHPAEKLPPLTTQQKNVIQAIEKSNKNSFILHGETGSGKTRLYLERALKYLNSGKSAIILTPEISLVPQLISAARSATTAEVIEIHSGLTKTQRNKNWLKILESSKPSIVIGTRSATFAPLINVGLIAVDEMHEPAYKQESAPRYQALRVAAKRAQISQAEIIYGSATPSVVEYFLAKKSDVPILRLTDTAIASEKPKTSIIDIKDKGRFSRHRYISNQLLDAIEARLKAGEQSLLFLNRRGSARQILCQKCGWQSLCPKCDLPLTLHSDAHEIRCHTCGYHSRPPYECPSCSSNDIIYKSLGTKALVDDLQRLYPEAQIRRFDTDNLAAETLARQYSAIHAGEIDILVGTQMLGKGLDLPLLSLVGIVNADTALHMPDFSSAERGYQLLHQAIGRVGRGHKTGEVIIQTFQPDDSLVQAAAKHSWGDLYKYEINEREQYMFPPYCYLLKITVSRKTSKSSETYINKLVEAINSLNKKVEIQEPSPSFHERSHGKYNWQLVIKARDRKQLTQIIHGLPAGDYIYDIDPLNLL